MAFLKIFTGHQCCYIISIMSECIEITVKTHPEQEELVSYILMDKIGCSGTASENGFVKGYLKAAQIADLGMLKEWNYSTKIIKDEDWAENWKKYWHPIKISEKIVIRPSWETYEAKQDEIVIKLDPGSAFGTGTHPTTRLCVKALEKAVYPGCTIADVGTGSGILSICGVKLGAKSAVGVDNDPSVISVSEENARANAVDKMCRFYAGRAVDIKGTYDVVVSNILAEVIIDIFYDLKKLLKPDGTMILSGIIERKALDVEDTIKQSGLRVKEIIKEEGWVAIVI